MSKLLSTEFTFQPIPRTWLPSSLTPGYSFPPPEMLKALCCSPAGGVEQIPLNQPLPDDPGDTSWWLFADTQRKQLKYILVHKRASTCFTDLFFHLPVHSSFLMNRAHQPAPQGRTEGDSTGRGVWLQGFKAWPLTHYTQYRVPELPALLPRL